jgi:hypothetical protein
VDFRNTVVIMTLNLGSQFFRGEGPARCAGSDLLKQALRRVRNRIDETVVFQPLGREEIGSIVEIQARHLVKRLVDRHYACPTCPPRRRWPRRATTRVGAALKRTIQRMIRIRWPSSVEWHLRQATPWLPTPAGPGSSSGSGWRRSWSSHSPPPAPQWGEGLSPPLPWRGQGEG